jgi:hypothetical protein
MLRKALRAKWDKVWVLMSMKHEPGDLSAIIRDFNKLPPVTDAPAAPNSVVLSAFNSNPVCHWDSPYSYESQSKPMLGVAARAWAEENTSGFTTRQHPAANFLMEIVFASERDAVLFKMFWL